MSETITYPKPSGATYTIPDVGDFNWGQAVTDFLVTIPNGTVPTSGTFTLTGDLSWGTSFGLLSKYFTSLTANPATAGVVRLAKTDTIDFRNNANSGNNVLAVDSSDRLTFNGSVLAVGSSITTIAGTANQVTVTNPTGPTVTLSLPTTVIVGHISADEAIITNGGLLEFELSNNNSITIGPPNGLSPSYSLLLPPAQGANHAIMENDGSGNLSWTTTPTFQGLTATNTVTITNSAQLNFHGSSSGQVAIAAPATGAVYPLVLPNAQGGSNTFLENDGSGNLSWGSAGGGSGLVLQVLMTADTTQDMTASTTFVVAPHYTVTITPASVSSRFLIQVSGVGAAATQPGVYTIMRNSTNILGTLGGAKVALGGNDLNFSMVTVDSPATTSAIVYSIGFANPIGGGNTYIGDSGVYTTTIIVTELAS